MKINNQEAGVNSIRFPRGLTGWELRKWVRFVTRSLLKIFKRGYLED